MTAPPVRYISNQVLTDLNYVDASVPAPNSGYFYVIAVVDWAGERYLGTTSDGLPRVPALPCP